MLKLEKEKKDVKVSFRGKTHSFDRTLFTAFAIAFSLHLFGVILFHVQPFRLKGIETVFPPVAVNIEFTQGSNGSILTDLEEKQDERVKIAPPPLSSPKLPEITLSKGDKDFLFEPLEGFHD